MNCPKCQGGAYLSEEDVVTVIEKTDPIRLLIKQTFVCRACSERFSRIVADDIESRKNSGSISDTVQTVSLTGQQPSAPHQPSEHAASGIQFLDNV
ncbi:MAG: hypothetical protein J7K54_01455 [Candidatus Aenigmarchaeota archaeon]|nr:hypothetical protein [Candidatus Aenigmarchaeota archaeon]